MQPTKGAPQPCRQPELETNVLKQDLLTANVVRYIDYDDIFKLP